MAGTSTVSQQRQGHWNASAALFFCAYLNETFIASLMQNFPAAAIHVPSRGLARPGRAYLSLSESSVGCHERDRASLGLGSTEDAFNRFSNGLKRISQPFLEMIEIKHGKFQPQRFFLQSCESVKAKKYHGSEHVISGSCKHNATK